MAMDAMETASEMQGFKLGYVQSDEASFLLTDFDDLKTEAWFDYNLQKLVSISASAFTAYFNKIMLSYNPDIEKLAMFDARAFNIPLNEVTNYFLWRYRDWERNSLQMYTRANFSQKQMHGKKAQDMHDMLHSIGKTWATDLSSDERNGTLIFNSQKGIGSYSDHDKLDFDSLSSWMRVLSKVDGI